MRHAMYINGITKFSCKVSKLNYVLLGSQNLMDYYMLSSADHDQEWKTCVTPGP
jgi:hypothetical protein